MKIFIISDQKGDSIEHLIKWAQLHNFKYSVLNSFRRACREVTGETIICSSQFLPSRHLIKKVFSNLKRPVCSPLQVYRVNDGWDVAGILYINSSQELTSLNLINLVARFQIKEATFNYRADSKPESELDILTWRMGHYDNRFRLLTDLYLGYWYKFDLALARDYYGHLWLNYYTTSCHSDSRFNWVSDQSIMLGEVPRQKIVATLKEAEELNRKSNDLMRSDFTGYLVEVPYVPKNHPLTLPGLVMVKETDKSSQEIDMSVTVVMFYYDLGYADKPSTVYLESLKRSIRIRHPVVFYGDPVTCLKAKQLRGRIGHITVIPQDVTEWPLIKKYHSQFVEKDLSKGFKKSPCYALLTLLKIYAIEDAINRNLFLSPKYAWLDPGLPKHQDIWLDHFDDKSLFRQVPVVDQKVTIGCFIEKPGSSEEEFMAGKEKVGGAFFIGSVDGWKKMIPIYDQLVNDRLAKGYFMTEQVYLTRLIEIHPELFKTVITGFDGRRFDRLFFSSSDEY